MLIIKILNFFKLSIGRKSDLHNIYDSLRLTFYNWSQIAFNTWCFMSSYSLFGCFYLTIRFFLCSFSAILNSIPFSLRSQGTHRNENLEFEAYFLYNISREYTLQSTVGGVADFCNSQTKSAY